MKAHVKILRANGQRRSDRNTTADPGAHGELRSLHQSSPLGVSGHIPTRTKPQTACARRMLRLKMSPCLNVGTPFGLRKLSEHLMARGTCMFGSLSVDRLATRAEIRG